MPAPERGIYACATCAQALYCTDDKQNTPSLDWVVFSKPVSSTAITTRSDISFGLRRTEIICSKCGTHLGHLFKDSGAIERHNISPDNIKFLGAENVHLRKRSGSLPTSTVFAPQPPVTTGSKLAALSVMVIPIAAAFISSLNK
eukprot:TRINITY_DN1922_c0_g1_i1.p1 TRINITY_DN1922_c0_g1~~TRINITY_DN1922_c0_g1_i1.p1  ORF type:complete len:144 (-),score=20.73 TRINITY_DN1922_c0_g1_i1:190-621(-)